MKDWSGNENSVFKALGASNHTEEEREQNDYYATQPKAVKLLLDEETFNKNIWEPACGGGHVSEVLKEYGYSVRSSDLIDRGYPGTEVIDFLAATADVLDGVSRDIITNPPYKYAKEFVEKSLELSEVGAKIAMFLKLTFWKVRRVESFLEQTHPKLFTCPLLDLAAPKMVTLKLAKMVS